MSILPSSCEDEACREEKDELRDQLVPLRVKLAAAEAREAALRRALEPLLKPGTGGLHWMERLEAALAAPAGDEALRELGLRCVAIWEFGEPTAKAADDDTRASMEQTVVAALKGP